MNTWVQRYLNIPGEAYQILAVAASGFTTDLFAFMCLIFI